MSKRKSVSRLERYAAVILHLKRGDGRPFIEHEAAKHMTAAEIVETFESLTHDEHRVPVAIGGTNHPTNLDFMTPQEHAPKTKIDVREIAKTKRIAKRQEEFRRRLLAKTEASTPRDVAKPRRAWSSRPLPGTKASGVRKRMSGKTEKWGARNG
jgi:hypothetical protein